MSTEIIKPSDISLVRERLKASFDIHGDMFESLLHFQIQLMIGWRVDRKNGSFLVPDNPDNHERKELIYDQRACEIYKGKIIEANSIWETHDDIRERGEIPSTDFRVSAEMFHLKNLPKVPIIRLDADLTEEEITQLNDECVLLNPHYKIL